MAYLGCELNDGDAEGWTRHTRATAVWHVRPLPQKKVMEGTGDQRKDMQVGCE